eukprot:7001987-Pyramimonas_sp.AAC.1
MPVASEYIHYWRAKSTYQKDGQALQVRHTYFVNSYCTRAETRSTPQEHPRAQSAEQPSEDAQQPQAPQGVDARPTTSITERDRVRFIGVYNPLSSSSARARGRGRGKGKGKRGQ